VAPQPEPATLIPLATSVSHGVRIPARRRSTDVLARSSTRSHGVCWDARNAPASATAPRISHAVVVMVSGCGSGGPQGDDIANCPLVAVRRERGIAVAVAAKIGAGHPVTRRPQAGSEKAVPGPQITHARHQHHQSPVTRDVVADPPLRAAEIAGFQNGRRGAGLAAARRTVRGAHALITFGFDLGIQPAPVHGWPRRPTRNLGLGPQQRTLKNSASR